MIKLGIVMDPIATINIKKDTSFAMLLEAQRRGYELHYMEMNDLNQRRSPRPYAQAERRAELRQMVRVQRRAGSASRGP